MLCAGERVTREDYVVLELEDERSNIFGFRDDFSSVGAPLTQGTQAKRPAGEQFVSPQPRVPERPMGS